MAIASKKGKSERGAQIAQFQSEIAVRLGALHGVDAVMEWRAMQGQLGVYSPRLDVAVGPFATRELQYGPRFDGLLKAHHGFVQSAYEFSNENCARHGEGTHVFGFDEVTLRNWNARCLFAIKIENRVTRKHLMGGARSRWHRGRMDSRQGGRVRQTSVLPLVLRLSGQEHVQSRESFGPKPRSAAVGHRVR